MSAARMSLAMVLLLFAPLLDVGPWSQLGVPHAHPVEAALAEPPIVWIDAGDASIGSTDADVRFAIELCYRSRPIEIRSMAASSDGACGVQRFFSELPRRRVHTAAYGIDRTEVTQEAFTRCATRGRCVPSRVREDDLDLGDPRLPVTGVTQPEAEAYCRFAGGRLPTEEEWERAARGRSRRRFPWGAHYNSSLANHGRAPAGEDRSDGYAQAAPVGSFPAGASRYGLDDMAGNVWEWTASAPRLADVGVGLDPSVFRVVRGGSWAQPAEAMRVTHRVWFQTGSHASDLGFRCAYDAHR
ncbi:MAG: formylglycine-generating enzyme family protein [Sandaracinaceae bacterium]